MSVPEHSSETNRTKPHDAVVRYVLSKLEHAREFLELLLSEKEYRWFDPTTMRIENPVSWTRRGQQRTVDLLISVRGRKMNGGRRKKLLVVLEHKSGHDRNTVKQMYEYILRVREQYPDEWLFPAVLYHGRKLNFTHPLEHDDTGLGTPDAVAQMINDYALRIRFKCRLLNLRDQSVQQDVRGLRIEPLIYILARIWILKESDVEHVMGIDPGHGRISRINVMGPVMEYIMSMKSAYNWERFIEIEARVIPSEEDRIMATLMTLEQAQRDRGRQEGLQEGLEKGLEEGLEKGLEEGLEKGLEEGLEKGLEEGLEKGLEEGEAKKQSEIAGNMIRAGVDDQDVVNYTGISVESVADLKSRLNGG